MLLDSQILTRVDESAHYLRLVFCQVLRVFEHGAVAVLREPGHSRLKMCGFLNACSKCKMAPQELQTALHAT